MSLNKVLGFGLVAMVVGAGIWVGVGLARQKELLDKNGYKIVGVKVDSFSKGKAVMLVYLEIENKTDIAVDVKGYNFDVKINQKPVTKAVSRMSQHISANTKSVVAIRLEFDPKVAALNIVGSLLTAAFGSKGMGIELSGFITASHAGFTFKDLPVTVDYVLKDQLPTA